MSELNAEFQHQVGAPATLSVTDPDDGVTRHYAVGVQVFKVIKKGMDPTAMVPIYQIMNLTSFTLINEQIPEHQ